MLAPADKPPQAKSRSWYHPLAIFLRLILYVLAGYIGLCGYLYLVQTKLIYPQFEHPIAMEQAFHVAQEEGLVPWNSTAADPAAFDGYVPTNFVQPTPRGTVVVFHGNGGWCNDRIGYVRAFERRGFRTFLYEYPGFGGRPGRPSEKSIVPEARDLVRSLDKAGYGPIYVWGESLGAGVAAAVCADPTVPVHGLVLLTPWDTLANVGLSQYPYIPVKLLMTDKYDSIANLQEFKYPICVVRSEKDSLILPPLSLNLFANLPDPKKMIVHPGADHNTWPADPALSWWDDALNFIAPQQALPVQ